MDCKYPGLGHLYSTYYLPAARLEKDVLDHGDLTKPDWGKKAAEADGDLATFIAQCESAKIPIPKLDLAW